MRDDESTSSGAARIEPGFRNPPLTDPADPLYEERVSSRDLHHGRYLTFRVDTIRRHDGSTHTREICGHPGAVAIVALDDEGRLLLVRQFRIASGRALLEIPAGTLDVDPSTGAIEDPGLAAPRELEEETGHRAGRWRELTTFWTAPGFATEQMWLYLATELRPAHDDVNRLTPDDDEALELVRLTLPEALAAVDRGEIADAKSILGILWLARMQAAGSL